MENNRQLKIYLEFFKDNEIDLSKSNSLKLIDNYFDRDVFFKNVVYLENNKFIVKNTKENNILFITQKGEDKLLQLNQEIEYGDEKERIEFQKSKTDLILAQKMLKEFPKTKLFSRISLFIAIVLALKELYILIKPILWK